MNYRNYIEQFNFPYINGADEKVENAYDVALNSIFVMNGIRPSFMIQEVDYKSVDVYNKLIRTAMSTSTLLGTKIDQGYVLFNINNVKIILHLILKYNITHNDILLGKILGLPCYKEFDPSGPQKFYEIYIEGSNLQIMACSCKLDESVRQMDRLKDRMQDLLNRLNIPFRLGFRQMVF